MLRACFFATGLFVCLWGASFLFIDSLVLNIDDQPQTDGGFRGLLGMVTTAEAPKVFSPPEWAAFSLISIGAVTMLYSVALPKRPGNEE
jgi:hypothetical protein